MGFHGKIRFLWGVHDIGGIAWKGRLGQFADLRGGGLSEKEGGCVDTPMHTIMLLQMPK